MIYTDENGIEFDLAPRTEKDQAEWKSARTAKEKLDLLKLSFDDAYLTEKLGSTQAAKLDADALCIMFDKVHMAYEAPAVAARIEQFSGQFAGISDLVGSLNRITEATNVIGSRQGFSRVK